MENVADEGAPLDLYWQDSAEAVVIGPTLDDSLDQALAIRSGPTSAFDSDESAKIEQSLSRRRRRKNGMLIRERRTSARDANGRESDADSEGSGTSYSNSTDNSKRQQHPNRISIDSDLHSLNLRSPLSPLEPPYHSLRHKPSNSTTIGEPDTPLASLVPPVNFAEQFKYIICSSGLLEDRPKSDQRRTSLLAARSRHTTEVGHRSSFISTYGYGTDLERDSPDPPFEPSSYPYQYQEQQQQQRPRRPARSSTSSRVSTPALSNVPNAQIFTRYPISRPSMTSHTSCGSTNYLTASSNSSRTSTPTMILNPLPIVDFDEPVLTQTPIMMPSPRTLPDVPRLAEGLRQRRRQRSNPSPDRLGVGPDRIPLHVRRRPTPSSWSYLAIPLFKFGLRSTCTLAGYLWMWVGIQMSLIYGIGSWMWEFGWKVLWSLIARKRGNKTGPDEGGSLNGDDYRDQVGSVNEGSRRDATLTPLVLRTEPSETSLAVAQVPVAVKVDNEAVVLTAKTMQTEEPSLQASALEVLTRLVSDNDAFEKAADEAFEKLEQADLDDGHDPLEEALRSKLYAALEGISSSMTSASMALMPLVSEQDLNGLKELYKVDDVSDGLLSPGWDRHRFSSSSRDSRGLDSSVEHSRRNQPGEPITTPIDFDPLGFPQSTPLNETGGIEEAGFPFDRHTHRTPTLGYQKPSKQLDHTATRPALPSLRSSQSVSSLRRPSTTLMQDRFTPLPPRSPRPSSVIGQTTWNARNKKRTQSLIGDFNGLGRSNSVMSDRDYQTRRKFAHSIHQEGSGRDSPYLDTSTANSTRPPSRLSSGRRSPLTDVHLPNHYAKQQIGSDRPLPQTKESHLKPLLLPAQAQRERSPVIVDSASIATADLSSSLDTENATKSSAAPTPDPRTHQRKRSSLQSIGFRRPSSVTQARPSDSPRPVKQQPSFSVNEDQGMHDFIRGLPMDLVASLSRVNSRTSRHEDAHRYNGTASQSRGLAVPGPRSDRSLNYNNEALSPGMNVDDGLGDPLALPSLKAKHRAIHAVRRQTACRLLALQFHALQQAGQDPVHVARYWADVHGVLTDIRASLIEGTSEVTKVVLSIGARACQPWLNQTPMHFAPQKTDARILKDELNDLSKLVEVTSRRVADIRHMVAAAGGDHTLLLGQWRLLRSDLGRMIGDWERGRVLVHRMTGTDETFSNTRAATTGSPASACNEYPMLDRETNTSTELSLPSIPSMDEIDPDVMPAQRSHDDASVYLLNSTSPAFLPPPGIESVFEDFVTRLPPSRSLAPDGRKLTREERIQAVKLAREETRTKQAEKSMIGPGGGMDMTSGDTKARTGEVVTELKDVIDRIRKHRQAEAM